MNRITVYHVMAVFRQLVHLICLHRRARYLLDGAKHVVEKLSGMFPMTAKDLLQVAPGHDSCHMHQIRSCVHIRKFTSSPFL